MRTVNVALGERSYPIHIGSDLLPRLGEFCAMLGFSGRCAVITDSHVAPHHGCPCFFLSSGCGNRGNRYNCFCRREFQKSGDGSKMLRQLARLASNAVPSLSLVEG